MLCFVGDNTFLVFFVFSITDYGYFRLFQINAESIGTNRELDETKNIDCRNLMNMKICLYLENFLLSLEMGIAL